MTTLPGCGQPATAAYKLYSIGSLDVYVHLCPRHRDPDVLAEATGLTPLPVTAEPGRRCGDGFDYVAMRYLHAPSADA